MLTQQPGESSAAKSATDADSTGTTGERTLSPLAHLTAHSARFGVWEVLIFNPTARTREYLWNKEKRKSYIFQCMLVSTADPTQYVLGDSHGRGMNETKLAQLKERFKAGLVFQMSKVVFAENTKQQYNSAPKTEVVSMVNTQWTSVLSSAGKPLMPEPSIPVAASMGIEREQHFDALALVQEVSESSNGGKTATGQARLKCQILLNDGSVNADGKVCHLPVTIFADQAAANLEPELFERLRGAQAHKIAVAFFGIQGKQSELENNKWSFTSSFGFFCENASDIDKGRHLEAEAVHLVLAPAEAVPLSVLQSRSNLDINESFEDVEATETTCALVETLLRETKVKRIEEESMTFWQVNWCHVHVPERNAQVCTNDNSRLWMLVKVEDDTGFVTMYMREKAALSLSGTDSKEEFEAARADDSLDFPNKASIKIIRKTAPLQTPNRKNSAEQPANIQCYIVEAAEQALEDTPSKGSLLLLELLARTEVHTDACAAAGVSMIKKDPHYGLRVSYVVDELIVKKYCTRAFALVIASSASKADNMNEGYRMITENVSDPLDKDFVCTLMSFCTVKTSPEYQLKPARGIKTQTAIVLIADVLEAFSADKPAVFLVESLQKIPDSEAEAAPDHIRRLIHFASFAAKIQGKCSERGWTDETSPANAGKCRRLGKSPTNEELQKYNKS